MKLGNCISTFVQSTLMTPAYFGKLGIGFYTHLPQLRVSVLIQIGPLHILSISQCGANMFFCLHQDNIPSGKVTCILALRLGYNSLSITPSLYLESYTLKFLAFRYPDS
ncbi:unnamed protein product [Camellia sinensis]